MSGWGLGEGPVRDRPEERALWVHPPARGTPCPQQLEPVPADRASGDGEWAAILSKAATCVVRVEFDLRSFDF